MNDKDSLKSAKIWCLYLWIIGKSVIIDHDF